MEVTMKDYIVISCMANAMSKLDLMDEYDSRTMRHHIAVRPDSPTGL